MRYPQRPVCCSNVDRRRGHRCSQFKWPNLELCNPLFETVFEDRICLFEKVFLWKSRNSEVWTILHRHVLNICRHTLTYTHRVIYALSAASRFRDQALLSNDMGVEKLNEAERWLLITEQSRVHWCTDRRERETLISLVVRDCFCGMGEELSYTPAWTLTCFSQCSHSYPRSI